MIGWNREQRRHGAGGRRALAWMLLLAILAVMTGCRRQLVLTADPPAQTESSAEDRTEEHAPVIACILRQDDTWTGLLLQGAQDAADAMGARLIPAWSDSSPQQESALVAAYVEQEVDGILLAPVAGDTSAALLEPAAEAGIRTALVDSPAEGGGALTAWLTTDDAGDSGRLGGEAAEILRDSIGSRAVRLAILEHTELLPEDAGEKVDHFLEGMARQEVAVEIVSRQEAWIEQSAREAVEALLGSGQAVDAIFAASVGATIGAVDAVQEMAEAVPVFGCGLSEQFCTMLQDGASPLKAVAVPAVREQGYRAVAALIASLEDEGGAAAELRPLPGSILSARFPEEVQAWQEQNSLS